MARRRVTVTRHDVMRTPMACRYTVFLLQESFRLVKLEATTEARHLAQL
jgi:hypothetical protein